MKKFSLFCSIILLSSSLFLTSCNKKSENLKYIPKNAIFVSGINGKSIALKMVDFQKMALDIFKEKNSLNDSLFANIQESGVDFLEKAYIFGVPFKKAKTDVATTDETIVKDVVKVGVVISIKDAAKFNSFVEKMAKKEGISITKKENSSYFNDKSGFSLAWTKDVLIVGFLVNNEGLVKENKIGENLLDELKADNTITANEKFAEIHKKDADILFWLNYEFLAEYKEFTSRLTSKMGTDVDFKETYLAFTVNFEDGKINTEFLAYTNEANQKKYGDLYKTNLNDKFVALHPGKDLNGLIGLSMNMKGIENLLKQMNLLETANTVLKNDGFTVSEVLTAFSGDFLVSINGVHEKEQAYQNINEDGSITTETKKVKEPVFAFSFGIGNKPMLDKIITAISAKGLLLKTAENEYNAMGKMFMLIKENSFIGVNSSALAKQLSGTSYTKLSETTSDLLTKNAMVMNFDLSTIDTSLLAQMGVNSNDKFKKQPFESFLVTCTTVKDKKSTGSMIINLKNKKQNSLVTFMEFAKENMPKTVAEEPVMEEPVEAVMDSTAATSAIEQK